MQITKVREGLMEVGLALKLTIWVEFGSVQRERLTIPAREKA